MHEEGSDLSRYSGTTHDDSGSFLEGSDSLHDWQRVHRAFQDVSRSLQAARLEWNVETSAGPPIPERLPENVSMADTVSRVDFVDVSDSDRRSVENMPEQEVNHDAMNYHDHQSSGAPVHQEVPYSPGVSSDDRVYLVYRCDSCRWTTSQQIDLAESDYCSGFCCPSCITNSCQRERNYESGIQDYSYVPEPVFFQTEAETRRIMSPSDKPKDPLPYLAFELEVEADGDYSCSDLAGSLARAEWYFKSDGSLSDGFEVVSHPFTYDYFRQDLPWQRMLTECRDSGFLSYDTDTCGIHVHVSKNAFTNYHLYRFMRVFYKSYGFSLWLSRRSRNNFDEWANHGGFPQGSRSLTRAMSTKAKEKYYHSKYEVVNLAHPNSVEVRIFRGTLNADSFRRNIETVYAAYQYSRPGGKVRTKNISPVGFAQFVKESRKDFPRLFNQLWHKGHLVSEVERPEISY